MSTSERGEWTHLTVEALFGIASILVLGLFISIRGYKEKKNFYQVTGTITSIIRSIPGYSTRHAGKMRYIQVEGYPKPFELFIGKDPGDFSPAFERIDQLKPGDLVTIYYDEDHTALVDIDAVNRLTQFIDRDLQPFFVRSNTDKYVGYFALSMALCIGITLLLLNKNRKRRSLHSYNFL